MNILLQWRQALPWPLAACLSALPACLVREYCQEDRDCGGDRVCDQASGSCVYECQDDEDCGGLGFTCEDHRCRFNCEDEELDCPEGMVSICGVFCMDIYEASRPDADTGSAGSDSSMATSRDGVLPWYSSDSASGMNPDIASAACEASGKRLCTTQEWRAVCRGPDDLSYSYGDQYDPLTCNGIDTFCHCEPHPGCYHECGADFRALPTGSFPDCTNTFGIFDINGNVWELVATTDGLTHYRGGAYNCSDSERLHHCDFDAVESGSFPSAKGFRCCAEGAPAR